MSVACLPVYADDVAVLPVRGWCLWPVAIFCFRYMRGLVRRIGVRSLQSPGSAATICARKKNRCPFVDKRQSVVRSRSGCVKRLSAHAYGVCVVKRLSAIEV